MEKIAFFDAKPYDRESFDRENGGRYEIRYLESRLNRDSAGLAAGCSVACAFVNGENTAFEAERPLLAEEVVPDAVLDRFHVHIRCSSGVFSKRKSAVDRFK